MVIRATPGLAARRVLLGALIVAATACGRPSPTPTLALASPSPAIGPTAHPTASVAGDRRMLIGTEYVLIDNAARADSLAEMLAPVGLAVAKPLPEQIAWDKMQPTRAAAIDFAQLDNFVSAFQGAGFSELILALKSNSAWASRAYGQLVHPDPAPKPEFVDDYEAWISAGGGRHDGDGDDDTAGLGGPGGQ